MCHVPIIILCAAYCLINPYFLWILEFITTCAYKYICSIIVSSCFQSILLATVEDMKKVMFHPYKQGKNAPFEIRTNEV